MGEEKNKMIFTKLKSPLMVVLIAFLLTIIFTWPFASKLNTFFYDRGDYPVSLSILSYNEGAIRSGKIFDPNAYFRGNEFYPQPYTLIYFDFRLVPSLIYSPIFWITSNHVFSINSTLFLAFIFSFIASFYTIHYFVRDKLASIIGAVVYTFNPITFSRFPEHFDLFHKYFLPLVFLFAYRLLKSPNLKDSFLFFLTFTLNAFSAISYQIFTMVTLPFFALPFLVHNLKNSRYFINIFKVSFIFLIFLPLFIYFDTAYLKLSNLEGLNRPIELNSFFSARLIDYVSSSKQNFIYGQFVKSLENFRVPKDQEGNFNYLEHTLFLNIIPTFLFLIALIHLRKSKLFFSPFLVLLVLSFLLTLGPFFQGWNGNFGTVKLPFYYLYQLMPFLQGNRTPARFEFILYIPFSIMAAYGFYLLSKKLKKQNLVIIAFLIVSVGLFLENYNPNPPLSSFNEKSSVIPLLNKIDYRGKLAFLKGKQTLHLPVKTLDLEHPGLDSYYLNWAALTGETVVNGNIASYIPKEQLDFLVSLVDIQDEKILNKIFAIDVNYIVIHKSLLDNDLEKYEKFLALYNKAAVYDKNNLVILDLSKLNLKILRCNFEEDINLSLKTGFAPVNMQTIHFLYLKNKSDCYLPSIYTQKYKNAEFKIPDLFGNLVPHTIYFKLPVVIEPFEEVILNEQVGDLRIEKI